METAPGAREPPPKETDITIVEGGAVLPLSAESCVHTPVQVHIIEYIENLVKLSAESCVHTPVQDPKTSPELGDREQPPAEAAR